MLQETLLRLQAIETAAPITICNVESRFIVAEQLKQIKKLGTIILEPEGKNTAPAVALAAQIVDCKDDPLLLVLASDHSIEDQQAFGKAIQSAIPLATKGKLVTFGVKPDSPHTGYGYIKRGESVNGGFVIDKFVEKPDEEMAQTYVKSEDYYWNSGMFLFKASKYLEELKRYRPDIFVATELSLREKKIDLDFIRVNDDEFVKCPSESIDYAIMEETKDAVVVPLEAGWSDVGSWSALWNIDKKNNKGNSIRGDVISHDTKNCLIYGSQKINCHSRAGEYCDSGYQRCCHGCK